MPEDLSRPYSRPTPPSSAGTGRTTIDALLVALVGLPTGVLILSAILWVIVKIWVSILGMV